MDTINLHSSVQIGSTDSPNREKNQDQIQQRDLLTRSSLVSPQDQVSLSFRAIDPSNQTDLRNTYSHLNSPNAQGNNLTSESRQSASKLGETRSTNANSFTKITQTFDSRILETPPNPALRIFEQISENNDDFQFIDTFA